jgi:hypothetical protein
VLVEERIVVVKRSQQRANSSNDQHRPVFVARWSKVVETLVLESIDQSVHAKMTTGPVPVVHVLSADVLLATVRRVKTATTVRRYVTAIASLIIPTVPNAPS